MKVECRERYTESMSKTSLEEDVHEKPFGSDRALFKKVIVRSENKDW